MNQSKIGVRYAKALLEFAREKNKVEDIYKDVVNVEAAFNDKSDKFYEILLSPVIKLSSKLEIIEKVFKNKVDDLTLNFILLVVKKGREQYFEAIFRNFYRFYYNLKKIKNITIITPVKPNEKIVADIKALAHKIIPEDYIIKLNTDINKNLIGGFLLEVEDYQFDVSVKNKLQEIKNGLLNSTYKIKL